jgi:hypothetical protein
MSPSAKDLLNNLLNIDHGKRYTAEKAMDLGCAVRFVFRFIPVLIFQNSGYSEFRGTHVGIKSFQGKINVLRNSGGKDP